MLLPTLVVVVALGIAIGGTALQIGSGDGAAVGRRTPATWAREALGRLLILALSPLGWTDGAPPRTPGPHPPVLLVPGYGTNRSAFTFLTTFLAHRGWTALWPVNHAGREAGLETQARLLARRVDTLKRATGAEKVDILGFSMGGLVGAWYVTHLGGAEHVRRLITVATPWRGTRFAQYARTEAGRQLDYESPELAALDPSAVRTIAIWSPDDPVVIPASSAAPAGAETVQVDGAGHLDMMLSARTFRAVHRALSEEAA